MNFKQTVSKTKMMYYFLLTMIVLISGVSIFAISNSSNKFTEYREMAVDSNISKNLLNELMLLRMSVKNVIQYEDQKSVDKFYEILKGVDQMVAKAQANIQNPSRARLLSESKTLFAEYKDLFAKLIKIQNEKEDSLNSIELNHQKIISTLGKSGNNDAYISYLKFYNKIKDSVLKNTKVKQEDYYEFKKQFASKGFSNNKDQLILQDYTFGQFESVNIFYNVKLKMEDVIENGLDKIGPKIANNFIEISRTIQSTQDELGPALVKVNDISRKAMFVVSIICLSVALFFVIKILKSLNSISLSVISLSSDLNENSLSVKNITDRTSRSSDRVAESSQEQAASLEETSSSLEEMDGMARKNLESVKTANINTHKMKEISEKANSFMQELVDSMEMIKEGNKKVEEISSVISEIERKTRLIDEIVSQTKILSFNASVEAERAGEHGKGFAVVAEEVGNLAKTSGEAAKEIQDIVVKTLKDVESTVDFNRKKVENGNNITKETSNILSEINSICLDVLRQNEEVLNATDEQVQGIKQINIAVSELDKTTQDNTIIAQETSAVAKELDQRAQSLAKIVSALNGLIGVDGNEKSEELNLDTIEVSSSTDKNVIKLDNYLASNNESTESQEVAVETKKVSNDPWDQI